MSKEEVREGGREEGVRQTAGSRSQIKEAR